MIFDANDFQKEVLESDIPVLVDFFAVWCGPCKMMSPLVEKMAEKYAGKVKIGKVDVEDSMEIARKYGVMQVPTFIFFKSGEAVETHLGGMSAAELEAKIQKYI